MVIAKSFEVGEQPGVRLPSASTCDMTLRLPEYTNMDDIRKSISYAVEYGCIGFAKA